MQILNKNLNLVLPFVSTVQESDENDANVRVNPLVNREKEQKTTKLVSGVLDDLSRENFQLPYIKYWRQDHRTSNDPGKTVLFKAKRTSPSASKPTLSLMKMLIKMKAEGFDIRTHRNDKVK